MPDDLSSIYLFIDMSSTRKKRTDIDINCAFQYISKYYYQKNLGKHQRKGPV